MPLKIVRNDITKMRVDAIVNTANSFVEVGPGCDRAIYEAAGYEQLLAARREIGELEEGEAALTPGFLLPSKYIIHAVSPLFLGGNEGEEEKLRLCYRNSLRLALENQVRSIAFPLIATGSFGYPKEEGMRIAVDEINTFLLREVMDVYLVVFSDEATHLGEKIYPALESYIDRNYVGKRLDFEYGARPSKSSVRPGIGEILSRVLPREKAAEAMPPVVPPMARPNSAEAMPPMMSPMVADDFCCDEADAEELECACIEAPDDIEKLEDELRKRMEHVADTFQQYLFYLIEQKGLKNSDVYNRAIVDKKVFSKIKGNPNYHPSKRTAMCLCVGAMLNLDETRDLLARAGYAISPCAKEDIIFSFFIENEIYDMIELDIQLEEHGIAPIIE